MAEYDNFSRPSMGYPYADNDINFKQNLLKLSHNPEVQSYAERYRHKEMADSFLTDFEIWVVDNYERALTSYLEIDIELRLQKWKELEKKNKEREKRGLPLIRIEETVAKMPFLRPTIIATYEAIKNVTQLAKSRNGIAVKTAVTQKIVQVGYSHEARRDDTPRGIFGQNKPKQNEVDADARIN